MSNKSNNSTNQKLDSQKHKDYQDRTSTNVAPSKPNPPRPAKKD